MNRAHSSFFPIVFAAILSIATPGCANQQDSEDKRLTNGRPSDVLVNSGWELQDMAKVKDTGDVISKADYSPQEWYQAVVPGTVLTSLVANGVYPDPLYGENGRRELIPETLCRTQYWYRTQVSVPADYSGKTVWLNFEGINYIADVWVNGTKVGDIRGAFIRGIFDITPYVKPGESAAIAVLIHPPPNPGDPHEQTVSAGTGRNGGTLSGDGPTFLCTMGWDWIPGIRDRDMGIWQDVKLSATGPVVIDNPLIVSDLPLPKLDEANLKLEATLRNTSASPQSGMLNVAFEGVEFQTKVDLAPGESKLIKLDPKTNPELHVKNPKIWWPNGYGNPDLYRLKLRFDIGSTVSDSEEFNFGIREIAYQHGESDNLAIVVNGVPVFAKGGNWGMDEAMKRIPPERIDAQVRYHKLANLTMIRNWVGQSTSEALYDACDRFGILMWDEFFQPNPVDGPNPRDVPMYLNNVRDKVLRYRNHPSIVLWCARNEGNPPPEVDEGIKTIMAELEPVRVYQASSTDGRGVRSGGPYSWQQPRNYYRATLEPFKTEIGGVSIPTLESIKSFLPSKDWESINDAWAWHDLTRGAQQGRRTPPYGDMIFQRYGKVQNLPDFVRKAQLANYEAWRALYEARLASMFDPCTAVLIWMSNPAQPSFVWQLYSHDLEANASLFAAQKACEPIHVMMNESNFHLTVLNNTPKAFEGGKATVRVFNLDSTLKHTQEADVTAPATDAIDLGEIKFPEDLTHAHFVKLELRDSSGKLVSDNFYWRAKIDAPDDFTSLETMPTVSLDSNIARRDRDGKVLLDVTLSNPTDKIALMAHVQLRKNMSTRVLPTYYSENYVTLLPGEKRTITVEADAKQLGDAEPLIMLDGFNVTTRNRQFAGASMRVNTAAIPANSPQGTFSVVAPSTPQGQRPPGPPPPAGAPPANAPAQP